MDKKQNLKELGHNTLDKLGELKSAVVLAYDGEKVGALVAGQGKDIVGLLANTINSDEKFKKLVEMAYLAASNFSKEEQ